MLPGAGSRLVPVEAGIEERHRLSALAIPVAHVVEEGVASRLAHVGVDLEVPLLVEEAAAADEAREMREIGRAHV